MLGHAIKLDVFGRLIPEAATEAAAFQTSTL